MAGLSSSLRRQSVHNRRPHRCAKQALIAQELLTNNPLMSRTGLALVLLLGAHKPPNARGSPPPYTTSFCQSNFYPSLDSRYAKDHGNYLCKNWTRAWPLPCRAPRERYARRKWADDFIVMAFGDPIEVTRSRRREGKKEQRAHRRRRHPRRCAEQTPPSSFFWAAFSASSRPRTPPPRAPSAVWTHRRGRPSRAPAPSPLTHRVGY